MQLNEVPIISVIVPVHLGRDTFVQCLDSLRQAVAAPHEVIVVGDGVGDAYDALMADYDFDYIKLFACQGAARARNAGARVARGDILFFVDSDVEVPVNVIDQILAAFQQNSDMDALIGSYDDSPDAANFLSQYKNLFHHYVHQNSSGTASTFWGACGAIKRRVFWQLGGFDASYQQATVEDIEFGYRLRDANHRIQLIKSLQVKHLKRWETGSLLRTEFVGRALPWTRLIWRDRKLIDDLNLQFSSRLSTMLVLGLLIGLAAAMIFPEAALLSFVSMAALLWLNYDLYRFFWQKRGVLFAIKTIPWHWFYFFYSGAAFVLGSLQFFSQKLVVTPVPDRSIAMD